MKVKITRDGKKNVVAMVWGKGTDGKSISVLDPATLQDAPPGIKLDQIQYTIEAGTTVFLGWADDGSILPVEGRGLLNYYQFDSLQPTTPGQALWVSARGNGAFHLVLDCTKMGS